MDLIIAAFLGIVQGITEWLPISSSGHLALMQNILGLQVPVLFDILLHLGTILAVIIFFRKDIVNMIKAISKLDFKGPDGKMVLFILIALIPTAIIGFAFKDLFESFFYNLTAVGIAFLATGCFLFVCDRWPGKGNIRFRSSLLMGFAQGIAIIPGISRSGATIGTGLLAGIDKEKVARFSFILAVPAILGASVFDFNAVDISSIGWDASLAGIAVSAVAGYASIKFLLGVIKKQKFRWFAVYCWLIGVVTLLLF